MSFIVSFKTDDFVIMASDKRITYVKEARYSDDSKKIKKVNNYIYGTTGSGELGRLFDETNNAKDLKEFIDFSNSFFDMLEKSKQQYKDHWKKQNFDLTLQIAGMDGNKTYLSMYQTSWREDGFNHGIVPSTIQIPCYVGPNLGEATMNYIENYIIIHHPRTVDEAAPVIKHLMELVSSKSIEVSAVYDIEFLK